MEGEDVLNDIASWQTNGDREARNRVLRAHLRLVPKQVRRYQGLHRMFMDAVQEGMLGLMVATDRYDPSHGVKFVTYAMLWIRAYILPLLHRGQLIRATTRAHRKVFYQIGAAERILTRQGIVPTAALLAEQLDVKREEVEFVLAMLEHRMEVPLNGTDDESGRPSFELAGDSSWRPDERYMEAERLNFANTFSRSLAPHLDSREREILLRRTLADEPQSLNAIGKAVGLSSERVRQIERRMLKKLRELYVSDDNVRRIVAEARR